MPNFRLPGRRDASAEDAALAALLSGSGDTEDLSASLRPAADVLAALRARPSGDELAGESAAMAEFRDRVGVSGPALPTRRRRQSVLSSLLTAKAAAAALAVAVVFGGVASVAYAGALPSPAQRIAHDFIGAPAAHHAAKTTAPPGRTVASHVRHRRHHHFRPGCFVPRPHRSWSASPSPSATPTPSMSPTASPSPSPSCPPVRHHPFRHHRRHPFPTKFSRHHMRRHSMRRHHFRHHHRHMPYPHPSHSPQPQPTPSPTTSAPTTT
jgi:hypothetical protein